MRTAMKMACGAALAAVLCAGPAAGQRLGTRGLLVTKLAQKKTDGLEVKVVTLDGQAVDPQQTFRNADCEHAGRGNKNCLRVKFRGNFNGYVYFVNVASEGYTKVIYAGRLDADWEHEYELPAGNDVIGFTGKPGIEVLKVVMSQERIPLFENALKNADGRLGASAQGVAQELSGKATKPPKKSGGQVAENVGIVQPTAAQAARCRGLELAKGRCQELVLESGQQARARGLTLAKGSASKNEGTLVAISDKQGAKLESGEVAVFEIRLRHV
jgi:hypothetical protein